MAWLELHTVLIRHRKTKKAARVLNIKPAYMVGHLTTLWANVLELAEDGDITKWSIDDIAEYAEYDGDSKKFYNALINQGDGWIDEIDDKRLIHDWWDYAGRYLKAKYKTHNPERLKKIEEMYGQTKDRPKTDFGRLSNQSNQSNQSIKAQGEKRPAVNNLLKTELDKVLKDGLNIYSLINKVKKGSRIGAEIPEEVLLRVCGRYWQDKGKIKAPWPWFKAVVVREWQNWQHEDVKNAPIAQNVAQILAGLIKKQFSP